MRARRGLTRPGTVRRAAPAFRELRRADYSSASLLGGKINVPPLAAPCLTIRKSMH
jgi:hypothetical protein